MNGLLIASSPVEIGVLAEEAGFTAAARDAALRLFHALSSEMELDAIGLSPGEGAEWPRHRFYFGETAGAMERLQGALAGLPDLADAAAGPGAGTPRTLFLRKQDGAFSAVLLAGHDAGWLDRVAAPLEAAATRG